MYQFVAIKSKFMDSEAILNKKIFDIFKVYLLFIN